MADQPTNEELEAQLREMFEADTPLTSQTLNAPEGEGK